MIFLRGMFDVKIYQFKNPRRRTETQSQTSLNEMKPQQELKNDVKIPCGFLDLIQPKIKAVFVSDNNGCSSQVIPEDTFFIRMQEYEEDKNWAQKMVNLTYSVSSKIKKGENFDDILFSIETGVQNINMKETFGVPRYKQGRFIIAPLGRGVEYYNEYRNKLRDAKPFERKQPKPNDEYSSANVCQVFINDFSNVYISYGWDSENKTHNMDLVKKEYEKLRSVKNPTDEEINRSVATIHWLIAQESPFERGNDSIANLLTKAIYHAYGMEITPIKVGKSFDFEAFFTDLDEYIEKYPTLFEVSPHRNS